MDTEREWAQIKREGEGREGINIHTTSGPLQHFSRGCAYGWGYVWAPPGKYD